MPARGEHVRSEPLDAEAIEALLQLAQRHLEGARDLCQAAKDIYRELWENQGKAGGPVQGIGGAMIATSHGKTYVCRALDRGNSAMDQFYLL